MIYFIQDQSTLSIKIGFTDGDPEGRLRQLQTGNPTGLVLLCSCEGDKAGEAALHMRFAHARGLGEWFRPVSDLIAFIAAVAHGEGYGEGYSDRDSHEKGHLDVWKEHHAAPAWLEVFPEVQLVCPVCGFDYNHRGEMRSYGNTTALQFRCEENHLWELQFFTIKGETYVRWHQCPVDDDDGEEGSLVLPESVGDETSGPTL